MIKVHSQELGLLNRVQQMEQEKAAVREILQVLAVLKSSKQNQGKRTVFLKPLRHKDIDEKIG
ncbi:hypothetical protein [Nostoc sp. 'Lobaria pulmonaria (5183) cyanobiont']|uniref:hypothetical protein n=1 Tax=Nostoc sp. 'Lobaria pulmonaria (5183) cyanobiont' TaxID=1618022 RepID=UPI000CF33B8F|nr:hypothetical protein [Nostoc sp. 'Lobaria pulmonaria (5183) cyanobiont']